MMFYAAFKSIHAFPCFTSTRLGSKSVTKKPRGSLAYESNTLPLSHVGHSQYIEVCIGVF